MELSQLSKFKQHCELPSICLRLQCLVKNKHHVYRVREWNVLT
jgi:hypothetical protein